MESSPLYNDVYIMMSDLKL